MKLYRDMNYQEFSTYLVERFKLADGHSRFGNLCNAAVEAGFSDEDDGVLLMDGFLDYVLDCAAEDLVNLAEAEGFSVSHRDATILALLTDGDNDEALDLIADVER